MYNTHNTHNIHSTTPKLQEKQTEALINSRAQEILSNIWAKLNARLYTKSTSKTQFYETNLELAVNLAKNELLKENEVSSSSNINSNNKSSSSNVNSNNSSNINSSSNNNSSSRRISMHIIRCIQVFYVLLLLFLYI